MYVESSASPCFEDPNNNSSSSNSLPQIVAAGDPHVVFSQTLPTTNNNIDTNNDNNINTMSIEEGLMVQGNIEHALMMQQQGGDGGNNNWDSNRLLDLQDLTFNHENPQNPNESQQNFNNNNINNIMQPTPDLLNLHLFHNLPKPNNNSSGSNNISNNICLPFVNPNQRSDLYGTVGLFGDNGINPSSAASVLYDPLFHLNHNLPTQTPLFRDLFQSYKTPPLFDTYNVHNGGDVNENNNNSNNIVVGVDSGELGNDGGLMYLQDGDGVVDGSQFDNTVFEYGRNMGSGLGKRKMRGGKATKHFTTERERRSQLNDKFAALRSLIPSPSKNDRASVVGDAIEYIKELIRTVKELKSLVKKKRCGKERSKMLKIEDTDGASGAVDGESTITRPVDDADSYNGSMRTSWLQRKSKVTEVDVRIIDDEVTIKVVQRKKINCLLHVSRVLDELQLDLHHVAGGHIGEHYSFLFNSKIYEGSNVYASAIASKLIEAVDREYAVAPAASSY